MSTKDGERSGCPKEKRCVHRDRITDRLNNQKQKKNVSSINPSQITRDIFSLRGNRLWGQCFGLIQDGGMKR
ncbi:hypothetical protein GWI33_004869 [Rhynchophorus ferrugineus]|uniref:Uncharacterized protein n=1 Tax=Rhynchophorus ferrugineus TaxID=354439 RepID=A0A834IL60_RHYFE|nr:hypothetical protein GWI33_004869 [Rhynchophorus ferrugineus]